MLIYKGRTVNNLKVFSSIGIDLHENSFISNAACFPDIAKTKQQVNIEYLEVRKNPTKTNKSAAMFCK